MRGLLAPGCVFPRHRKRKKMVEEGWVRARWGGGDPSGWEDRELCRIRDVRVVNETSQAQGFR